MWKTDDLSRKQILELCLFVRICVVYTLFIRAWQCEISPLIYVHDVHLKAIIFEWDGQVAVLRVGNHTTFRNQTRQWEIPCTWMFLAGKNHP